MKSHGLSRGFFYGGKACVNRTSAQVCGTYLCK